MLLHVAALLLCFLVSANGVLDVGVLQIGNSTKIDLNLIQNFLKENIKLHVVNVKRTLQYGDITTLHSDLHSKQFTALIGEYHAFTAMVSTSLNLPYFVVSPTERISNTTLHMQPTYTQISNAVTSVIHDNYRWSSVAILFEREFTPVLLRPSFTRHDYITSVWRVTSQNVKDALVELRNRNFRKILILAGNKLLREAMQHAIALGVVAKPYQWLCLDVDGNFLEHNDIFQQLQTNITFLKISSSTQEKLDIYNQLAIDSMNIISNVAEANRNQHKIASDVYKNITFNAKSGLILFGKDGRRTNVTFEIQNVALGKRRSTGSWNSYRGLKWHHGTKVRPKYGHLTDGMLRRSKWVTVGRPALRNAGTLSGSHIKIVVINEPPFVYYKKDADKRYGNDKFEGFLVEVIEKISNYVGFTFELYEVPDGRYGTQQPSGNWNGLIGEVMAHNASLSLAPLTINADRERVIDFTKPFLTRGITMLMSAPKAQTSFFQFLLPLSDKVWLVTFLCFIVLSLALFLAESRASAFRSDMPKFDAPESFWFMWGSLVGGSTESSPVTIPGRLISSAWWLFSLILVSTYTANLAAFLTVKKMNPPVSSVADLVSQRNLQYGTVKNSAVLMFFQNSQLEPYKTLWDNLAAFNPNNLLNTTEDGLERVRNDDFVFLWDSTVTSYFASKDCELIEVGRSFDPKGLALATPQGSLYREELSIALLKLIDAGVVSALESKYWTKRMCGEELSDGAETVTLEHLAGIFLVLLGGLLLSVAALGVEKILRKSVKRHRQTTERKKAQNTQDTMEALASSSHKRRSVLEECQRDSV